MKFPFLPEAASTLAHRFDLLFAAMTIMTGVVALVIVILTVVFAVKYRRGGGADRARAPKSVWRRTRRRMEVAWIADANAALRRRLRLGGRAVLRARSAPPRRCAGSISVVGQAVDVEARSTPTAGARSTSCTCRSASPVKLMMTSQDVIHSFFVPAFRVKQDVLPGRYTTLWFTADRARRLPPVLRASTAAPTIPA